MIRGVRNTVIFFLFSLLCVQGCRNGRVKGPAIRFESETWNFGEINRGVIISHTFSFSNPGSDTLVLESVRSSCSSCTIIDKYDKKVAPGESGKISITYKVKGSSQHIINKVFVDTNIPDAHKITLIVTGNITGKEETPEGS